MLARALTLAATMLATASAVELTKATFQAEVKDSGKNAFVSLFPGCPRCRPPALGSGLPALPPSCAGLWADPGSRARRLSSSPLGEATANR